MTDIKRPMLACTGTIEMIDPGFYAAPKLDGVRALVTSQGLKSRTMKPIRNKAIQDLFSLPELIGLDGELILGEDTDPDVYRKTVSVVNSISHGDSANVTFHVFDDFSTPEKSFRARYDRLADRVAGLDSAIKVDLVPHRIGTNRQVYLIIEEMYLEHGYEGMMVRNPKSPYKQGRSTALEKGLLKLKRFVDAEAIVVRLIEQLHNNNPAEINELGRTKRSTAQDNMEPAGVLGAIEVKDLNTGQCFCIGSGFTNQMRQHYWEHPEELKGKIVTYQFFPTGVKDRPRFPTFKGVRPTT